MPPFHFLSAAIAGAVLHPLMLMAIIAVGVFFLEDPTTLIVALLAADHQISIPFALGSLYIGIVLGDVILYGIGYLASTHPRLGHYVDHELVTPFRAWLETRFALAVFSARFVPFARFPTYTTSGFFRSSFSTFILVITGAAAVWTTLLFSAAYWFGNVTAAWEGPLRWGVAALALIALFSVGHRAIVKNLPSPAGNADTADDIHTT